MPTPDNTDCAEVFISYASRDGKRVEEIADTLTAAGASLWMDRSRIEGGDTYGPEIVRAIKGCKVLALMCSDAAFRSRNVKQEIMVAWKYGRPFLPLLLEPTQYPEQLEYWLEGHQWIEVLHLPAGAWLARTLRALAKAGVRLPSLVGGCSQPAPPAHGAPGEASPVLPGHDLKGLRTVAKLTDQLWPMPADAARGEGDAATLRGLGAPQEHAKHRFHLGSQLCLAMEATLPGHVLLLDEGPAGVWYSLCPSWFAPSTEVKCGRNYFPQPGASYRAFELSGVPGREHLLAIITDTSLGLDWMTTTRDVPSRVLSPEDMSTLLTRIQQLEAGKWTALSTFFDVLEH